MLNGILVLLAVIIFTCIFLNNVSSKVGVPVLLLFIVFGMLFGIEYHAEAEALGAVEQICTVALIFIMFYGGFGTRWTSARPVAVPAGLLATIGVVLTAVLVGVFCHYVLKWGWIEGLLMGSVICSTDAASVFSILRAKKLGLKNRTAPLLEIESGSNDPCSYMMTAIMLSVLKGQAATGQIVWMVFSQLFFGAVFGLLIAQGAAFLLKRIKFASSGFDSLFLLAVAITAYALPSLVGGNGYLSAYIVGIVLGNTKFPGRKPLIHFFDGLTGLMQIVIFFLLGLMSEPTTLHKSILPALAIFAFITLVARPLAVSSILAPFRKYKLNQLALISFVGLRGAASIVFAIMATSGDVVLQNDIFNIVFCIVLISILFQGSLIPFTAKKLKMIDAGEDVMRTFSDFVDEAEVSFGKIEISSSSHWRNRKIKDLDLPQNMLIALVFKDDQKIIPNGETLIEEGDVVITCSKMFKDESIVNLREHTIRKTSKWAGHKMYEYPNQKQDLVVLIRRGQENIIPNGNTIMKAGDILVIMAR